MLATRSFRSVDLEALYPISLATGHEGGDASHLYEDGRLIGLIYSALLLNHNCHLSLKMIRQLPDSPPARWTRRDGTRGSRQNGGRDFVGNTPIQAPSRQPIGQPINAVHSLFIIRSALRRGSSKSIRRICI